MESIKLKREVFSGSEFANPARFKLFVTLLILAEIAPVTKEGVTLSRGELVTSLSRLAKRSALTIKQVRNAIAALAKARKIIVRPTSLHTVITICNYEDYVI